MTIKIFKNWRLLSAVLLIAVVVNMRIISAATEEVTNKYAYNPEKPVAFEDTIIAYHTNVNEIFNENINTLINTNPEDLNLDYDADCKDKNGNPNISTFCVAKKVVDEYVEFAEGIQTYSDTDLGDSMTLAIVSQVLFERGTMIDLEKEAAFNAMDQTLAVYNELQVMYPLHQQYGVLIETLESYNNALAKWRTSISQWPSEFIDATTNKCS
ncbi:MAG: hypothetical protein ACD_51C00032G0001 [uncultured bacterium]|nr:MAG: hypothetical protein ACD_51C00032G0001 [uncultured bacterium]